MIGNSIFALNNLLRMIAATSNIAEFISNIISDNEMNFEIKHTLNIISGSIWENLKHILLGPDLPLCLKTECINISDKEKLAYLR